jgi:hypothetical protein
MGVKYGPKEHESNILETWEEKKIKSCVSKEMLS